MRRRGGAALMGCFLAAYGAAAAGCAFGNRHREVAAAEFLDLAAMPTGSVVDTRLVGVARGRAYLSVWSGLPSSLGGGEDIVSCGLDELPAEIAARLRAGENPWPR